MKKLANLMQDEANVGMKLLGVGDEIDKLRDEDARIHIEVKKVQAEMLQELAKDNPEGAEELAKRFGLPLKLDGKVIDEIVHLA